MLLVVSGIEVLKGRTLVLGSVAYWNGAWVADAEVLVAQDDLGFLMGVAVVERLRTFGGKLFRTDLHLERMRRSLEIMGWNADGLIGEIRAALDGWVERNGPLIVEGDDWTVGVLVTPGKSADAREPTVCVRGGPLPFEGWAEQFEKGLEGVVVETRQIPENCWPAELKCRSRMHYYLADREAEAKRPGARAILLDQEGFVGEGSTANVVAYFAGRGLVTPRRSKVLPGVTQQVLFEVADRLGIACSEGDLLPAELAAADEVFFTSTSICLLPVVRLDGSAVGRGVPGEMYEKLLGGWSELVGVDIAQQAQRNDGR